MDELLGERCRSDPVADKHWPWTYSVSNSNFSLLVVKGKVTTEQSCGRARYVVTCCGNASSRTSNRGTAHNSCTWTCSFLTRPMGSAPLGRGGNFGHVVALLLPGRVLSWTWVSGATSFAGPTPGLFLEENLDLPETRRVPNSSHALVAHFHSS